MNHVVLKRLIEFYTANTTRNCVSVYVKHVLSSKCTVVNITFHPLRL